MLRRLARSTTRSTVRSTTLPITRPITLPTALPVVAASVLALVACTGGDGRDAATSTPGPTRSVTSPAPPSSAPTSPAPKTAPEPESSSPEPEPEPEPLRAADGRRYEECADGECEVVVAVGTTFALDPEVAGGMDTFEITEIAEDGAGADFTGPGQSVHAFGVVGGVFLANGVPYTIVEVRDDRAVVRLGE